MPVAFLTGISGQDGHYLTRFLLKEGYEVVGLTHRSEQLAPIEEDLPGVSLVAGDITDHERMTSIIQEIGPDEIYNLAGFSFPPASITNPVEAFRVNAMGAMSVFESVRLLSQIKPDVKLYQASTSEMFGRSQSPPYDEMTPLRPETPYAASKAAAHHLVSVYRKQFGIFAVSGILFNHESPLRPDHYVTRKISQGVARISLGSKEPIVLGNIDAIRDWGFAGDYVEGMWLMMQQDEPDDFVLATNEPHSVREFIAAAFKVIGIDSWKSFVDVSAELVRPPEMHPPVGCPNKATRVLGWEAQTEFEELVRMMVSADIRQLEEKRLS